MNTINSLAEYHSEYKRSIEDPERFWEGIANSFEWKKRWDKVLDWNFNEPNVKWFEGGQLNITENCLDRHLNTLADKVAFHWVPNDINQKGKEITYKELYSEVCKFSNVLLKNGVKKGDRVCLYMPMVPSRQVPIDISLL